MPTTSKRKATDASNNRAAKKTRLVAAIVDDILADTDNYPVDDEDAVRKTLVDLAEYCRDLEQQIADSQPKELSPEELEAATEKVRITVHSGIRKQMTWKPTCKTKSAKWSYDGLCSDPLVFGHLLGLEAAPTFKMKKIPSDEFSELMGGISASVRYDTLHLFGDVNVRWNPAEGTFKFSGCYGKM